MKNNKQLQATTTKMNLLTTRKRTNMHKEQKKYFDNSTNKKKKMVLSGLYRGAAGVRLVFTLCTQIYKLTLTSESKPTDFLRQKYFAFKEVGLKLSDWPFPVMCLGWGRK